MFKRISRWSLLIIFAACNLAIWLVAAVVVGLVVSDRVDLGVETLIRERQATAIVVWEDVISKPAKTAVQATYEAGAPAGPQTGPALPAEGALAQVLPTATGNSPAGNALQQPGQATPTPNPGSWITATPLPASQPETTPVSSPLLLSDLEFSNLLRLDQEMNRSAVGRAVQIRYDEAALNGEIHALLENNPQLPYDNVHVDLNRERVTVTGDVTVLGFTVSTKVAGRVVAVDCLPRMEIETISIAGVLTPGFVKDRIKAMLLEALKWYPANYPLCLEQIVLEENRATIYGHRR